MSSAPAAASPQSSSAELYRCAQCAAPVSWDPEQNALACEYCGNAQLVERPATEIPEYTIAEAMRRDDHRGLDVQVRRIRCDNCGATVDFDPGSVAGGCAFCGAQSVAELEEGARAWRPEGLMPFAQSRDQALEEYKKWLGRLWFRPSDLQKGAQVDELRGVYLPYWLFDAHAQSWWKADAGHYYYTTRRYRSSDGKSRTRRVRRVRWSPASGKHERTYTNVPIYASQGLPKNLCTGIEPYPFENLVAYDGRYLAGFGAEEYVMDAAQGWEQGKERLSQEERDACRRQIPGDTHRRLRVSTSFSDAKFRHVLLPVWIAAYQYRNETYRFLVNGQTGKVQGSAPWSWAKISLAVTVLLAIALVVIYFVGYHQT